MTEETIRLTVQKMPQSDAPQMCGAMYAPSYIRQCNRQARTMLTVEALDQINKAGMKMSLINPRKKSDYYSELLVCPFHLKIANQMVNEYK